MKEVIVSLSLILLFATSSMAADGVINVQSNFEVGETANRLESVLKEKGMTLFSRIKHSEGAGKAGFELRDTELIIFGNPKVGSPLMICQQTIAIDLPQKALIWKDANGAVFISYNDPTYLQKRHNVTGCEEVFTKVGQALGGITKAAASK